MILALTALLVTVLLRAISQFGNVVRSAFPPCSRSTRSRSLIDCISVGVDRMQRNFEPMRRQVETWQRSELTDVTAKVVICEAFIGDGLGAPKHLTRSVHDLYFEPNSLRVLPCCGLPLAGAFIIGWRHARREKPICDASWLTSSSLLLSSRRLSSSPAISSVEPFRWCLLCRLLRRRGDLENACSTHVCGRQHLPARKCADSPPQRRSQTSPPQKTARALPTAQTQAGSSGPAPSSLGRTGLQSETSE